MRKEGFTLVEIVVSVVLLGIMSLAMVTVLSNNFVFLNDSKEIAEQTFLSQQQIELEVSDIKNQLKDPAHTLSMKDIVIDGVTVGYHEVIKSYNGYNYSFLVTPQQLPEYVLLNTFDVKATLKSGTADAFNVYPIGTSSIMGSNTPDPSTYSTHWMMDIYQWYVSRPGFNIPVPMGSDLVSNFKYYDYLVANGLESELGNRYPQFPDDYSLIGTATTNSLPDLTSYAGRHIVFKVIPAAKSGRLGIPEYSEPVFISGLTNTTNLALHLDASYLDPSYVNSSNQTIITNEKKVIKWFDLSSGIGLASPSESGSATATDKRPLLLDSALGTEFVGRYVRFDANKNIVISSQNTSGKWLYVYSVAKGTLGSTIFQNGGTNSLVIDSLAQEIDSEWKLVSKEYLSNDNAFTLGNNTVDVAEVIVYAFSSKLSDEAKATLTNEVSEYLENKYVPLDTVGEIDEILPISTTVFVGQSYTPPPSALAHMMSGLDRYVPIVWEDNDPVDTSAEGVVTVNGVASNDATKTVVLTVTIIPVPVESVSVAPTSLNLIVGNTSTLVPTVLPDNATYKQVSWALTGEVPTGASPVVTITQGGFLTAVNPGTVNVLVTSVDNPSESYLVPVIIQAPPPTEAEITNLLNTEKVKAVYNTLTVLRPTNSNTPAANKPVILTPIDTSDIAFTFISTTIATNRLDLSVSQKATVTRSNNNTVNGELTLRLTSKLYSHLYTEIVYNVSISANNASPRYVTVTRK